MAAVNQWADASVEASKKGNPAIVSGGKLLCVTGKVAIAAADSDGSVYKLARLPANAIPVKADLNCAAITGSTSWDLGLYDEDGTTVADVNLFMAAADLSGGKAIGSEQNGLADLGVTNVSEKLWELLGQTIDTKKPGYVLALTANAVGSAAGEIEYRFWYILG